MGLRRCDEIAVASCGVDTAHLRLDMHGSHGIVFQEFPWTDGAASDVRLDGYNVEWVVKGLFDGHLDARLILVLFWVVRSFRVLSLGIGIRTGVGSVIEQPFTL